MQKNHRIKLQLEFKVEKTSSLCFLEQLNQDLIRLVKRSFKIGFILEQWVLL